MVVDAFWYCFCCFPSECSYFNLALLSTKVFNNNYFVHAVCLPMDYFCFICFDALKTKIHISLSYWIWIEWNLTFASHVTIRVRWRSGLNSSFRDCSVSLVVPSLFDIMRMWIVFFICLYLAYFCNCVCVCMSCNVRLAGWLAYVLYEKRKDFTQ